VQLNNSPPQKIWSKRKGKHLPPSASQSSIVKETTLESVLCNESTTIIHAKRKEFKHKGKMHKGEKTPAMQTCLP